MRRFAILSLVVAVMVVSVGPSAVGQEATPEPPAQVVVSADITAEPTNFGIVDAFPPAPASITLLRIQMPPGSSIAVPASDPGLGATVITAGAVTLRGFTADVVVIRANQAQEVIPAGTDAELGPGDTFVWQPFVGGEIRNDGTEPAEQMVIDLRPGAEMPEAGEAAATPAA